MRDIKIRCPICGTEYLPAEIFLPNSFLGKPKNISKLTNGKIDSYDGLRMDLKENYICDNCQTPLKIYGRLTFQVEENSKENFQKPYVTKLNKGLFLDEE